MKEQYEQPTRMQRVLESGYRQLQKIIAPGDFTADSIKIARVELDKRHEMYVTHDVNTHALHDEDHFHTFSDAERERWFGKSKLKPEDITWEKMNALLLPAERRGAVARINGEFVGSRNNEHFVAMHSHPAPDRAGFTEAHYTPRTINLYDNKEQAIAAAKFLRILTKSEAGHSSVATILAETLDNGSGKPAWVVSDNMNMQTHNALRLYFTNHSTALPAQAQQEHQRRSQADVNSRLLPGEEWEALPGVPTLLTLQGRPGVKMFKKLPNGRDDPHDMKIIARIPPQQLPRIVKGVPHEMVIASDGREYFEAGDTFATIATILVGPKGYTFLRTGSPKLIGELVRTESEFALRPFRDNNTFARGRDTAGAIKDMLTLAADKALTLGVGTSAALLHGSMIAAGTTGYSLFKRVSGKDPMKNSIKKWVEERCGPLEQTRLLQVWEPRDKFEAINITSDTAIEPRADKPAREISSVHSPLGDVKLSETARLQFDAKPDVLALPIPNISRSKNDKNPVDFGHDFLHFMQKKRLWISRSKAEGIEEAPEQFTNGNKAFFGARDTLAIGFGEWFKHTYMEQEAGHEIKKAAAEQLATAMNDFSDMLRVSDHLPNQVANQMWDQTRDALKNGINRYLEERQKSLVSSVA